MKTFASLAAAAFALVAGASVANAQALVAQPYQTLIVQPGATVIRQTPLFAVPAGQPVEIISTVETVRTIRHAARPLVRHHVVASRKFQDRVALNGDHPLYNMAAEPVVQTAVATPAVQTFAADFAEHARHGPCDACARPPELPLGAPAQALAAAAEPPPGRRRSPRARESERIS